MILNTPIGSVNISAAVIFLPTSISGHAGADFSHSCLKDRRARARAEAAGATVSNVIAVPPCTRTVAFDADSGLSSDEDLWNFGDDEF